MPQFFKLLGVIERDPRGAGFALTEYPNGNQNSQRDDPWPGW